MERISAGTQWPAVARRHSPDRPVREYPEVLKELSRLEEEREWYGPQQHEELAGVQRRIRGLWEWLRREEVRDEITRCAVAEITRREPGEVEWGETYLVAVQQRRGCTGILIPYWVAQRGTQWLCRAPLAAALLVEDERPGSVDAEPLGGLTPEQVEIATALWADGGEHAELKRAIETAQLLAAPRESLPPVPGPQRRSH